MDAVVRPARASDREPLMSFIRNVWGGHDYIPSVWDDWLKDPRNRMFVVEVDGVPVGMNRLRFQEDGSAWLEGVRVHPDYRGRGLASMLGENSMRVARERGAEVFRLTSGSRNKTAHRQIARIKFDEVARFSVYEPRNGMRKGTWGERVPPHEAVRALGMLQGSPEFVMGRGVFWHNWGAASLKPDVVKSLVDEGAVWWHGGAVAVMRSGGEGEGSWREVGFLGGTPDDAARLARTLLGGAGTAERRALVPQGSPIIHALRESGFGRILSHILFERSAKG
ncbi:MAG: GNAT family N-acetyltransferase [Nitrososphaerota archaeon]|nr:GNAT family N-acetyltransferase [Nitrososphaerota archaeon]